MHIVYFSLRNRFRLRFYVMCAAIRMLFRTLSARQIQSLTPTTRQRYEAWVTAKSRSAAVRADPASRRRVVRDIQPLSAHDDSAILWVGDRHAATKFVLFFHGGGFVAPALQGHFEWCWNAYVRAGAEAGVEVAVAFLQYTLSPGALFPVQLRQATAALASLLDSGVRPGDIVMGGDSAGGNLSAQVLGHILHAQPDTPALELSQPLGGAFLVSPWLSCTLDTPSFVANDWNDMLSRDALAQLGTEVFESPEAFERASEGGNPWFLPLDTDPGWYEGLERAVSRVYVTVGKREILADHGIRLVKTLKALNVGSDIRLEQTEGEAHDFILLEGEAGEMGGATLRMQDWYRSVVSLG